MNAFCLFLAAIVGLTPAAAVAEGQPDVAGMEFDRIQVEWIAKAVKVRNLEDVLPRRQAWLLRQLACKRYECRAMAEQELAHDKEEAFETLCWGLRVADPQVQQTSQRLLSRLYVCRTCGGSGFTHDDTQCNVCHSGGDLRYMVRWVDGNQVRVRRKLFLHKNEFSSSYHIPFFIE